MDTKKYCINDNCKDTSEQNLEQPNDNHVNGKTKERHSNVLSTSKFIRSAVDHVRKHSYRDIDFMHTGTNISYRDEGGLF